MKSRIIFASKNSGKIKEVKEILNDDIELVSLLELNDFAEIEESGNSFEENARIKALEVFKKYKIPSIGDDSGLQVEQLYGAPGIYSARYAGIGATDEDNNRKLIRELGKFIGPHPAKYICYAVYFDGSNYKTSSGEVKGNIIKMPRGQNGFGYDPFFVPEGYSQTMAELSLEEKNKISHRSIAFRKMKEILIKQEHS